MLHFHETIYIRGNHDFTRENGVVSGNGTEDDPFIIEKLRIRGNLWNDGIRIENTDKYFVIRDCYIFYKDGILAIHLNFNKNPYFEKEEEKPYPIGIFLDNVSHGLIENCTIIGMYQAICLNRSSHNTVKNCYLYKNLCGIGVKSKSHHNRILYCKTMNYACGVCLYQDAENNTVIGCSSTALRLPRSIRVAWVGYYVHDCKYNVEMDCKAFYLGGICKNIRDKGLWIKNASHNVIRGSLFFGLPQGVVVKDSHNNIITEAIFINNFIGVHISSESEGNTLTDNIFLDNRINALDFSTYNKWNSNYWDDWIISKFKIL